MDVHLELTYATHYQMRRMYRMVVDDDDESELDDIYPHLADEIPEFTIPLREIMQTMVLCRGRLNEIPDRLRTLSKRYSTESVTSKGTQTTGA